jgi:hypothetical protein
VLAGLDPDLTRGSMSSASLSNAFATNK